MPSERRCGEYWSTLFSLLRVKWQPISGTSASSGLQPNILAAILLKDFTRTFLLSVRSATMLFLRFTFAFSAVALAADCPSVKRHAEAKDCLSREDAQQAADNFQSLSSEYFDSMADVSTTSDFTYFSDSLVGLINAGCAEPMPVSNLLDRITPEKGG